MKIKIRREPVRTLIQGVQGILITLSLLVVSCAEAATLPNGGWSPICSPDGSRVLFLSSSMHMPGKLWVMNVDGSGIRRLTAFGVVHPSWSSDGRSIFFSRWGERTANRESLRIEPSTSSRGVPSVPDAALDFAFSPDRGFLAYILAAGPHRDLWIAKADGTGRRGVTEKLFVRSVTWSPRGKSLLFTEGKTYGNGIWSVDPSTGALRNLVRGFCGTPFFSPDGNRIAYVFPWNQVKGKEGRYGIRILQTDGKGRKEYQAPHLDGLRLAWTPDGSGICYTGEAKVKGSLGQSYKMTHLKAAPEEPEMERAVWRLDLREGKEERLTPSGLTVGSFSWSPDGGRLLLGGVQNTGFASEVWSLSFPGHTLKRLVASRSSDWLPTPFPDGTRVAYLSNRNHSGMLILTDDEGREIRRFDPLAITGEDRIALLDDEKVLFLYNPSGFRMVDLAENTRLHLHVAPKAKLLELRTSLQERKILIDALRKYDGFPQLSLLTGKGDSLGEVDLGGRRVEMQPRWSFDGKKIAFTDGVDLWRMDTNGKNRTRLTHFREENEHPGIWKRWMERLRGGRTRSFVSDPFWSPDGSRIAYVVTVYRNPGNPEREVWWSNPDGSSARRIYSEEITVPDQTLVSDRTTSPFFDLDGKFIFLTSMIGGLPNLISVHLTDREVRVLTKTGALFPSLLPEQEEILYTALDGEEEHLMVMNLDGSGKRPFLIPDAGKASNVVRGGINHASADF